MGCSLIVDVKVTSDENMSQSFGNNFVKGQSFFAVENLSAWDILSLRDSRETRKIRCRASGSGL